MGGGEGRRVCGQNAAKIMMWAIFPVQSVCALRYINIGCTSIRSSGSQRLGMTSPSHLHS